nr:hypothetical protein BaRGS_005226 [Batillaria attramentaria]
MALRRLKGWEPDCPYPGFSVGAVLTIFRSTAQPDRETMTNITAIQRRNVGKLALRSHPMLAETRAMLDDFYRPHNQRLAELLHDRRFLWQDQ